MNTLETTPIEALALNYITDGLLNSVWTWIAVLTAAVSLWKIKLSSQQQQLVLTSHNSTSISSSLAEASEKSDDHLAATTETKRTYVMERQGSTKIKFSVHYEQKVFNEQGYESSDECGSVEEEEEEECLKSWCEDREKMWDMGWYKCQDLTVLDGSVVKLWDGRKTRCAAVRHPVSGLTW